MIFSSTIIPTIGRKTLSKAVLSVLNQEFSDNAFEVIVVNDSGKPLVDEDWQLDHRTRIINTNKKERSVARNTGADIAEGQFLHFLDDDDWLLPGALKAIWRLSQNSNSEWLYGSTQILNRQGKICGCLEINLKGNCFIQAMAGQWIPLQSSWINKDSFYKFGGFNPQLVGPEDLDLLRRYSLQGNLDWINFLISSVTMGIDGSTTDFSDHARQRRWAREGILDNDLCFHRLIDSIKAHPNKDSLFGRLTRIYLTSILWNVQFNRKPILTRRVNYCTKSLILARKYIFRIGFWEALLKPYEIKSK